MSPCANTGHCCYWLSCAIHPSTHTYVWAPAWLHDCAGHDKVSGGGACTQGTQSPVGKMSIIDSKSPRTTECYTNNSWNLESKKRWSFILPTFLEDRKIIFSLVPQYQGDHRAQNRNPVTVAGVNLLLPLVGG